MTLGSATYGDEGIWVGGTLPQTFTSGDTLYKGQIVTINSSGKVVPCTSSTVPIGVALQSVSADTTVGVAVKGSIAYIHADSSGITAGHLVGATTVGTIDGYGTDLGVTAPSGLSAHVIGVALETISADGTGMILIQ